jgi:hypothetical protein
MNNHELMSNEEMDDLYNFEVLKQCNCCDRHLCKRPKSMYNGWINKTYKNRKITKNTCQCNCRQNMRMLARKYDNTINPTKWTNIKVLNVSNNYFIV